MRMCLKCEKEIIKGEEFMIAVDRPYMNLWLHRKCFKTSDFSELVEKIREYLIRIDTKS